MFVSYAKTSISVRFDLVCYFAAKRKRQKGAQSTLSVVYSFILRKVFLW